MPKKLDQILVVDVEATCWDGPKPCDQENEIIEIGLCVVDVATLSRVERRSILVKPECSKVSTFCTELTTLTQADVDDGIPLSNACALLHEEYLAGKRLWASYGNYDRQQFERECAAKGIPYPFGPGHLNVKTLFAVSQGLSREVGMARALSLVDLQLEGTHHRGCDDAWNIAALLIKLLERM
ncbi:MAG: exonuclease domain-containing protein [Anaerolineae bacterium]|nr:exonuclease domain-containing protein [Anaerolineae bacterium]